MNSEYKEIEVKHIESDGFKKRFSEDCVKDTIPSEELLRFTTDLLNCLLESGVQVLKNIEYDVEEDPFDSVSVYHPGVNVSLGLDFTVHDKIAINRHIKERLFIK